MVRLPLRTETMTRKIRLTKSHGWLKAWEALKAIRQPRNNPHLRSYPRSALACYRGFPPRTPPPDVQRFGRDGPPRPTCSRGSSPAFPIEASIRTSAEGGISENTPSPFLAPFKRARICRRGPDAGRGKGATAAESAGRAMGVCGSRLPRGSPQASPRSPITVTGQATLVVEELMSRSTWSSRSPSSDRPVSFNSVLSTA